MHEKININFKMNIINEGQKHEIQFNEIGKRYVMNKKTFIKFKEPSMENNKYNQLMLICDEKQIVIIRNGSVRMKQPYIEKELTKGFYNNEYVSSEITTFTNQYDFSDENIYLDYDILFDDHVVGNYQMQVYIKGVEEYE
ncbi:DUF1934 domain-containing protein [Mycoplasmatota bacterium]|nr:DUF1934 domain-containing protein [Mycoplasmatota bacterium]